VLAALAILVVCIYDTAWTGQSPRSVRVATRIVPPFVFEEDGKLTGFSIDLWRSIAADLMLESEFSIHRSVQELLSNVESEKSDAGVAAISITAERSKSLDFSQPMFDSGLQILVRTQAGGAHC
jgi:polar amino acid transport system substrate-binding protein